MLIMTSFKLANLWKDFKKYFYIFMVLLLVLSKLGFLGRKRNLSAAHDLNHTRIAKVHKATQ
jgi:hypothetical protein